MRITVRFFGIVGDVAKTKEQTMDLPDAASIGDLLTTLAAANGGFAAVAKQVRAVVNGENAARDLALTEGDEVVLMRAIGGGS